ncbi:MAG: hypothetical protein GY874_06185 [Desulfobacteraceae bacterium]|nr:hypothetical protein [Desulfobacteraceae bacterium]
MEEQFKKAMMTELETGRLLCEDKTGNSKKALLITLETKLNNINATIEKGIKPENFTAFSKFKKALEAAIFFVRKNRFQYSDDKNSKQNNIQKIKNPVPHGEVDQKG